MTFQVEREQIFGFNENGEKMAEILFPEKKEGIFVIEHTFVDPSLAGQGIAGQLVRMAVDQITANGGQVEATCSYAVHWLEKHPVQ